MPATRLLQCLLRPNENPVYSLLSRGLRRQLHGYPAVVLFGAGALAAFSGYISPLRIFSFHVWFAIYFWHLFSSPIRFARRVRRAGTLENQFLATPVPSADYSGAILRHMLLLWCYAVIPYVIYYAVMFQVDPRFNNPIRVVSYTRGAAFHFIVISGMLWAATWASLAGGKYQIFRLLFYLVYIAAHVDRAILDIRRWPVGYFWIFLAVAAWLSGLLIAFQSRKNLTSRLST